MQQTQSIDMRSVPVPTGGVRDGEPTMSEALRRHWPEYLMEAAELGFFMLSACLFAALLGHPSSSVVQAIPSAALRQVLAGAAMGLTAMSIIYSPWGKQSGAHLNP